MIYNEHFSFTKSPFQITPDPSLFFFSKQHEDALIHVFYTILENRGAMVLTGECGCGKTLIARMVCHEIRKQKDKFQLVLIDNPNLSHNELLFEINYQLGISQKPLSKTENLQALNRYLIENHYRGKKTIIIVDEAQNIQSKSTLEEIRLLLNHHQENNYLLTLLLFGQPEFVKIIENFPQLQQRIGVRYHLRAFSLNETVEFVDYRLRKAGSSIKKLFDGLAIKALYEASAGVPRVINHLCDMSLLVAFNNQSKVITKEIIQKAREGTLSLNQI